MQKQKSFKSKLSLLSLAVMSVFMFTSCASKMHFGVSPVVPAAEGTIKVKTDKNKNHTIDLDVTRLSEPSRLTPPKSTYVVWMQTAQNGTKNLGSLKSSSGIFSSALKASLHTVTPFAPTGFFITAEDNADIQTPGGLVVLSTTN